MLELRQLEKRYPTGDLALNGVSLRVGAGELVGLIGPSGAGKSTLIRCVNRLVQPSGGQINLDGQDLSMLGSAGLRHARRQIGMIFQEYALIERLTVMENLLSGRLGYTGFWASWFRRFEGDDIAQAFSLLERVGLGGMENKRADALSGGQRQRVGIARALMQSPKLLLVDEPTASLDPKTSRQILRLILELWTGPPSPKVCKLQPELTLTIVNKQTVFRRWLILYDHYRDSSSANAAPVAASSIHF